MPHASGLFRRKSRASSRTQVQDPCLHVSPPDPRPTLGYVWCASLCSPLHELRPLNDIPQESAERSDGLLRCPNTWRPARTSTLLPRRGSALLRNPPRSARKRRTRTPARQRRALCGHRAKNRSNARKRRCTIVAPGSQCALSTSGGQLHWEPSRGGRTFLICARWGSHLWNSRIGGPLCPRRCRRLQAKGVLPASFASVGRVKCLGGERGRGGGSPKVWPESASESSDLDENGYDRRLSMPRNRISTPNGDGGTDVRSSPNLVRPIPPPPPWTSGPCFRPHPLADLQ